MKYFRLFAVWCAGLILVTVTGECIARRVYNYVTVHDPLRGEIVAPEQTVVYRLEGSGRSRWWEGGLRRSTAPLEQGVTNVLVLGDSLTEALQVDDADVYSERLEAGLNRAGRHWQLLNFGTSGASMADYVGYPQKLLKQWKPWWTIVQVQESDFKEDAWRFPKSKPMGYFKLDPAERLMVVSPSFPAKHTGGSLNILIRKIRQHSALAQFAARRIEELVGWVKHERPLFVGETRASAPPAPMRVNYLVEEQVRLLKGKFQGRVTLLFLSSFDPRDREHVTPFETELQTICDQEGVSFVSLSGRYSSPYVPPNRSPFGFPNHAFNQGHLNPLGHRLAAEALLDSAPFSHP